MIKDRCNVVPLILSILLERIPMLGSFPNPTPRSRVIRAAMPIHTPGSNV
ncbi:unnamed protein product [Periconia digitata]|uniref:Uncharacterized protein n=1 Tax=Periconia digitata TaxID=1303443 RepID=A0A9W4XMM8_9PLEO|nr:unnamed protein product [Periconia digitata]